MANDILLEKGERGVIIGATGSGKTAMLVAQIEYYPYYPIYIMDTKQDSKIADLTNKYNGIIITSLTEFENYLKKKRDDVIVRIVPDSGELSSPEILDTYLQKIYGKGQSSLTCIDEAYMINQGTRALPGSLALLTRGRAKGLSFLACTQRPAWLPRFYFTESQKFYVYYLQDISDRKRVSEMIPIDPKETLDKYCFRYYKTGDRTSTLYNPVKLSYDPGYIDDSFDNLNRKRWL